MRWLQEPAGIATIDNFLLILDRLAFLRKLLVKSPEPAAINPHRLSQLALRAQKFKALRLRELRDKTEVYALLMVLLCDKRLS